MFAAIVCRQYCDDWYYRRSSRRRDCPFVYRARPQQLEVSQPLPCARICPRSQVEVVMWWWDHLDWAVTEACEDLNINFSDLVAGCRNLLALWPPMVSLISFLAYWTCHLPNWGGLPLFSVSPCPPYVGAGSRLPLGGWDPTTGREGLDSECQTPCSRWFCTPWVFPQTPCCCYMDQTCAQWARDCCPRKGPLARLAFGRCPKTDPLHWRKTVPKWQD